VTGSGSPDTTAAAAPPADQEPLVQVVHVVTTLAIGGLEKVVFDLARCRTKDRFGIRVICLDSSGVLEPAFSEIGVSVEVIGTVGSVPSRVMKLARRLRQLRPHVVHTHNPQAHLHGAWASRMANVPAVVHTRHGRQRAEGHVLPALSRIATAWTSRFVAVSEDAARIARDAERVPAAKLSVIHNGIDVEQFSADRVPRPQSGGRAISVGRLDPIKDQGTLLRAVRLVVDRMPDFRLDMVGDGPSRPELEALRETLGLADHVLFHGYQEDVRPLLVAADVFLLSSISEGVSIALLEAMACGLPAVATDVGGNREVIVPGECGCLVPAGSPEALASGMLSVLADAGSFERMRHAARRRIEEQFNLRKVVAQYETVYNLCLARSA
jgi:sugar transferase (PEP-CTERM/EpsH1 system associated)